MGRMFGTDGVRGIANKELSPALAFNLGRIGAYVLTEETHKKPRIAVGKDTRISGDMLEAALIAGICSMGAEAVSLGVLPTPAVAYLTRHMGLDAGVVISASHNPFEYNGIKFFNGEGYKLSDQLEDRIESLMLNPENGIAYPTGADIGKKVEVDNAVHGYVDFLKKTIDVNLRGLKIAVDCANGASYIAAPSVLADLGAEIAVINNKPNGKNINVKCGSTHPEGLQKLVVESGAHIGLAFDGDADRLIAVDNRGNIVNGDHMLAIFARHLKGKGMLKKDTVVATVMSNMGLDIALKREKCNLVKTKVGDRYVLEEMVSMGYSIGGEQSGHIIFLDHNTTGDGLLTALQLLAVVKETGKKLSDLASFMKELPQVLVNAKVKNENKDKYMKDEAIAGMITGLEKKLKGRGRVLIRPSGTEPLIRVMLEGANETEIKEDAEALAKLIEEKLN
ncbi:MAG TPA: phosphoglucosamine mutase [Bacillota bacterium]|nr:phosphoglucosamine mutase [Bacillota bacterium]HNT03762.1 phosphoglucosamine mutase [Bacillota bacterium]HPA53791.1 phosphoglucosamine mutase [Bacillota bacterium]HPX68633.1 phosphoglucosamine mutase [Bacillota bacterium]HQA64894.1 phosphoglucosamine mutase [Bacillota bacterium]